MSDRKLEGMPCHECKGTRKFSNEYTRIIPAYHKGKKLYKKDTYMMFELYVCDKCGHEFQHYVGGDEIPDGG